MITMLRDFEIRTALKHHLSDQYGGNTLILDELEIKNGRARVDLAIICSYLHGFEIKSDSDTLQRLSMQANIYNSVMDRITLVVGTRHIYDAIEIVPGWWGIKLAQMGINGKVIFSDIRLPQPNVSVDGISVASLLWKDEALYLLEEIGDINDISSENISMIYTKLSEVMELEWLTYKVTQMLKFRQNRRVGIPLVQYDD